MSDIVQRLRDGMEAGAVDLADIMDAADEIERLRAVTEPMPKQKRAEVSAAEPVAWAVMDGDEAAEFCTDKEEAGCAAKYYGGCQIVPLYRAPQPTLTDAEQTLLKMLIDHPVTHEIMPNEVATLRGLLTRLA